MLKINKGDKFGKLIVLEKTNKRLNRNIIYKCKCNCGNIIETTASRLTHGFIKSCGCYQKERASKCNKKHGMSNTKLFMVWQDMIKRCTKQNHHAYKDYGGRGIKVCNEWLDDFMNFYNWAITNGYQEKLTIDRINNDGNYEPDNCRWVTMEIQCKNRRKADISFSKNPKAKKIIKLDLLGNYICTYDCIKSAMIDNNINLLSSSISACCKGKAESAYGYKWKYYKDYTTEEL